MLLTMVPTVAFAADNESVKPVMSGTCGAVGSEDSVKWELTKNDDGTTYTLTISGTGRMQDFHAGTTVSDSDRP